MTYRKAVLVDTFTCLYLKHLVLHTSRLDGPLLLVLFFAILCCIMHQGENDIFFPVTDRCPHRHFKCTIHSQLCSTSLKAEPIACFRTKLCNSICWKRPYYSSDNNLKLSSWFNERQDLFAVILLFMQSEISYKSKNEMNSQLGLLRLQSLNFENCLRFMFHFCARLLMQKKMWSFWEH